MNKLVLCTVIFTLLILSPVVYGQFYELTPTQDDNYINNNTVINFSASPYSIPDGNGNGVLIINSSDITLDCNESLFMGGNTGIGIVNQGFNNVNIFNCNITSYNFGIILEASGLVENNNLNYNLVGLQTNSSTNTEISSNTIVGLNNTIGIVLDSCNSLDIFTNTIAHQLNGIWIQNSKNLTFSGNVINSNNYGFYSLSSNSVFLSNDIISDSSDTDIFFRNTSNILLNLVNFTRLRRDWIIRVNVTDNEYYPIDSANIDFFNSLNEKLDIPGFTLSDGLTNELFIVEYKINISGQYNFTPHTINVSKEGYLNTAITETINESKIIHVMLSPSPDQNLPVIDNYEILPLLIPYGDSVQIGVNASDDLAIDEVWANITDPSGAHHHVVLINNDYVQWPTSVVGTYNITIFAEDTSFNVVNVSDSFYVEDLVYFNLTVLDSSDEGISTDLDVYVAGTQQNVYTGHDSDGEFNISLVEYEYELLFLVFSDEFELLLRRVPLSSGFNKNLGLDNPPPQDDFEYIYAVETDYPFEDARARIYYEDMDFDNESNIKVYTCEDWEFDGQECDDDWDELDNVTLNTDDEYAEFVVSDFSAFAIREDSYCGDGWCGPGETTSNCPDDCYCDDGDTRPCNIAHEGRCAQGSETCSGNLWSGCPSATDESCNIVDDDCDGVVDDVDGGASISTTKCQCYNDGSPLTESCNGIDDNCDGLIDNGADCCNNGQTRSCGPSSETGECKKGTVSCVGGIWSTSCMGAVYPENEICGDNKDNDCDGQIDEGCQVPNCGEGQINESCTCEGSARSSGYCCAGVYSEEECVENSWWILIVLGVVILAVLAALVIYFKSRGKELTWEELMKRYGRAPVPAGGPLK